MSEEDREDRMKDRLSDRFDAGGSNDSNDVNDSDDVVDNVETEDTDENDAVDVVENNDVDEDNEAIVSQQRSVRDTTGRTFYVGEDTLDELDALYKELEFRYYQKHGDDLPKNKQFYPALFDVVVENPDLVAEKLGMELSKED